MADDTCGSNGCLPPGGSMHTGEFWPAVHRGECRFRKDRPATPKPAASEIDEAAAEKHCRWIIANPGAFAGKDYAAHNAARAALAWKARADIGERWEKDSSLSTWFPLTAKEIDDLRSENRVLVARAEEAEAERDAANARLRVMESRMKQVHAALLASMSDEQLAQSVKAR